MKLIDELAYYMQGDSGAVEFCNNLIFVSHLWDDLIDKDKSPSDEDINATFTWLLVDIHGNPFFNQHAGELVPLMRSAILQWHDANILEKKGNQDEKLLAFMMRNAVLHILHHCMTLVTTREWMEAEGLNFRKFCARTMAEKFKEFREEMA